MNHKNKGGRPKKGNAEKLAYRVSVKLCTRDFYKLKADAKTAGIPLAELLRQLIRGCRITPRLTPEQAGWIRQVVGIANNVNQIARRANTAGYPAVHHECLKLVERFDSILNLITDDSTHR